jgi:hypothetical protein
MWDMKRMAFALSIFNSPSGYTFAAPLFMISIWDIPEYSLLVHKLPE